VPRTADRGYYEAEDASVFGGAGINTDHSKYSGSGFVDNMTTQGSGVTFTVNAAQAGPQPVHLRYANGPNPSAKTKVVSLIVNGTEVEPLSLPSTADWKTWAFATRQLNLNSGANTITLRYDAGDDGWVNVDLLKLGAERDICTPQASGSGYTSLFDGTLDSLAGWRQASAGSFARQADCSLKTVGNAGMLWWPGERFDKYSLKLDWKLAGDDNSGVFVGFPDPGNDWNVAFTRGHEVQIDATDDADSTTGSIYNYSAPDASARDAALNPPGQWNAYEIIVEGQRIQVFLNGVKINDYTNTDPNRMTVPGFIGVQNHAAGDDVFFRNIRIRKLDQAANVAVESTVGGTVPGALGLTLTASANLGSFPPGVTRDYTASLSGTVTSSEPAAELSVRDPSANATGRLVNGSWALAQPLQLRAGTAAFAPLSTTGAPLVLQPFTTPVGKQPVAIDVKQAIAETDSLRAGSYGKTLVFTLSATAP
jgi:hypothetical protein